MKNDVQMGSEKWPYKAVILTLGEPIVNILKVTWLSSALWYDSVPSTSVDCLHHHNADLCEDIDWEDNYS